MPIGEFAEKEKAKIQRLENRERALNIGLAVINAAKEKGTLQAIGETRVPGRTPFFQVENVGKLAIRKVLGESRRLEILIEIDPNNKAEYASIHGHGTIKYRDPEDNLAQADEQVVNALSEIAKQIGVDINDPELSPDPVILPDAGMAY